MASLVVEYFRRHGKKVALPVDEGICFFSCLNTKIVCITSSHAKSFSTCRHCEVNRGIILEVFVSTGRSSPAMKLHLHKHIDDNDMNLLELIASMFGPSLNPYYAKNNFELENWLWSFYCSTNPLLQAIAKKFKNIADQMYFVANNHPRVFELYYNSLHQPFLLNRKYMLIGT